MTTPSYSVMKQQQQQQQQPDDEHSEMSGSISPTYQTSKSLDSQPEIATGIKYSLQKHLRSRLQIIRKNSATWIGPLLFFIGMVAIGTSFVVFYVQDQLATIRDGFSNDVEYGVITELEYSVEVASIGARAIALVFAQGTFMGKMNSTACEQMESSFVATAQSVLEW
jgi:hypothetical protein